MSEAPQDVSARLAALNHLLRPADERAPSIARGVHHVAMICSDAAVTIDFYQRVIGFPLVEIFENRDYPGSLHFFFDLGAGNLLAFFDFPGLGLGPAIETLGSLQHLAISVTRDAFIAARARIEAEGIPYRGPDLGVENSIYLRDPDGIQIELVAVPLLDTNFT